MEAVDEYVSACKELGLDVPKALTGPYEIVFELDSQSLLMIYEGIFTKSGLEKLTGINQKQLWHYAKGISRPRQAQKQKQELKSYTTNSKQMKSCIQRLKLVLLHTTLYAHQIT